MSPKQPKAGQVLRGARGRVLGRLGVWLLVLALVFVCGIGPPRNLLAHGGGTPQLTGAQTGPYRLYAWTEPEPWRVGEAHLSLAVTKPAESTGNGSAVETPVTDAAIAVLFASETNPEAVRQVQATPQDQLNSLYYEADAELSETGIWEVTIEVAGPDGQGEASFNVEVLPANSINWFLVVAGFGILLGLLALAGGFSRRRSVAPGSHAERHPARQPRGQDRATFQQNKTPRAISQ